MSSLATRGWQILVVDDDPLVREVLCVALATDEYALTGLGTGNEALAWIRRERPAVVILDVVLPDLDGFAVCAQIKSDPDLSGTAVVLLTAHDDGAAHEQGLRAGADAYLTKPFSPLGLMDTLRRFTGAA